MTTFCLQLFLSISCYHSCVSLIRWHYLCMAESTPCCNFKSHFFLVNHCNQNMGFGLKFCLYFLRPPPSFSPLTDYWKQRSFNWSLKLQFLFQMSVELNWMQGLVHLIISMSTYASGPNTFIKHEMLQTVGLSFLTILLSEFLFYSKFSIPSQFHLACEINHIDQ